MEKEGEDRRKMEGKDKDSKYALEVKVKKRKKCQKQARSDLNERIYSKS